MAWATLSGVTEGLDRLKPVLLLAVKPPGDGGGETGVEVLLRFPAEKRLRPRDVETAAHNMRMSHYAHLIAKCLAPKLGLKDDYIEYILQYAPLHDVGKIGILDDLLLKPGKLDDEEFEAIKHHVTNGIKIIDTIVREFDLGHFTHLKILYNIIGTHHEKMNGSGYPKGLKGNEIPLEGRIIAVADVFDALTNPRVYKRAWSFDDSIKYLKDHSGSHFDPMCVDAVADNLDKFREIFEAYKEE